MVRRGSLRLPAPEPEALAREPAGDPEEPAETPAKRGKPSTEIKIEQVRELAASSTFARTAAMRVALVHPAEDMNPNAADSALERPRGTARRRGVPPRGAPAGAAPAHHSDRCVALAVPVPPAAAALRWLAEQGARNPSDGSRTPAAPRFARSSTPRTLRVLERLLQRPMPVDDRDELEALADALQKIALDRALGARWAFRRSTRPGQSIPIPPRRGHGFPSRAAWSSVAFFPAIRSIRSSFRRKCWRICRQDKGSSQVNAASLCS